MNHMSPKIELAAEFLKIYKMAEVLYCEDKGQFSIDPAVVFVLGWFPH